ncbi:MAG: SDR family oxidoreductase [Thermoflexales bacterium]
MILITGAGGYVAGFVIHALRNAGIPSDSIVGLVRSPSSVEKLRQRGVRAAVGDVTDPASLDAALRGVEQVVHLAAVNRDRGTSTMERINAEGTINVTDAAKRAGVRQVVTVVGLGADARRPFPLASTQGRGVDYLMASGVPYTVLEASVIFGAGDEFINTLAGLARIPPFMIVPGDGKSRFQPIAAQDVASCVVQSLQRADLVNRRLQICGSEVITLEGIIDCILKEMGLRRIKVHMPVPLLRVAVKLMEATLPKPPVTSSLLAQLGVDNVATDNATETVFGLRPIRLAEGIGFVREMTARKFILRTLGRLEYR